MDSLNKKRKKYQNFFFKFDTQVLTKFSKQRITL